MKSDSVEGTGKLLLIDDEEQFARVIAKAFVKHGFEVLTAPNGREGLLRARECLPDLILCDLAMPEMCGQEVLAALRRDERLAPIPVIFLTGRADPAEVRQGMNLGADDYLTKPVNLADLLGAVNARLRRSRAERQRQQRLAGDSGEGKPADTRLSGTFLVKTLAEQRLVKVSEVISVIAYGEYSWVYWDKSGKGALLRKSLKQWQTELPPGLFVRVHRRAIVNLAFLDRIEKTPDGRLQVHLRQAAEPVTVSLRLAPVLNRKLKALRAGTAE